MAGVFRAGEAPPFWWGRPDWRAAALGPAAWCYGLVSGWRMRDALRERIGLPVLCVGNLTVGGEGKTPVAIALARAARQMGLKPGFLSRGHGADRGRPHLVLPAKDTARGVGDEPLLLARDGPTMVTPDRAAGAMRLIEEGCDFIIMDDGFQSARIHIDYALIVIDARRGLGNGRVIPAGPLRAPLAEQFLHVTSLLRIGDGDAADPAIRLAARAGRPVVEARLQPLEPQKFSGRRMLAFAGIGNPGKFFASLEETGAELVETRLFPDHHAFCEEDVADLAALAAEKGLDLVTTSKDAVRLQTGSAAMRAFAERVLVLEIEVVFDPPGSAASIIRQTMLTARARLLEDKAR